MRFLTVSRSVLKYLHKGNKYRMDKAAETMSHKFQWASLKTNRNMLVSNALNLHGTHKHVQNTPIALWMLEDQILASGQRVARQACTDSCQQSVKIDCSQDQPCSVVDHGHYEFGSDLNWIAGAAALNCTKVKLCTSGCKADQVAEVAIVQW